MNRRSFLAAVLGAVAAPVVGKGLPAPSAWVFGDWSQYVLKHFTVWDSAIMRPGEVMREQLLPPPAPVDFFIQRIGVFVPGHCEIDSVSVVMREVSLEIKAGKQLWCDIPLFMLSPGFNTLPVPLKFEHPEDIGIYLHSSEKALGSKESVLVSIALEGFARV